MAESKYRKNLRQELWGVVYLTLALLLALSLISYSQDDPSLNTATTDVHSVNNILGIAGSHVSGALVYCLGLSAFWLPIFLLAASIGKFMGSPPRRRLILLLGTVLAMVGTAGFLAMGPGEITVFGVEFSSGGILGLYVERTLAAYAGELGAAIVLTVILIISVLICTKFSLFHLFGIVGNGVSAIATAVQLMVHKRRGRKEKARTREMHLEKLSRKEAVIHEPPPPPEEIKKEKEPRQQAFNFMIPEGEHLLPSLDLLENPPRRETKAQRESLLMNARLLEKKLLDFGVEGNVSEVIPGPVITMYEFEPAPGVKISKIAGLADDLALALRALSIRIVAPIPGKGAVGIEIPNHEREVVYLKEILSSEAFVQHSSRLALALGKDIIGHPVVADLAKMPHLLIAGATGTGKSVCLNTMILSILYKAKPDQVRFLMIDPKRIELSTYEGIPHLLHPVLTDPKKATLGLRWTVEEMERRYFLLSKVGARNITMYNAKIKKMENRPEEGEDRLETLPYIVVVIDELADLMMVSSKEVEASITRLAQMARAAGIHLILATQRPSVDVLTGIIKANFPVRISFQVSSRVDSRTILDTIGAERLLGAGDMLFLPPGVSKLQRIHGALVTEPEVRAVSDFLRKQGAPEYDESILAGESDDEDKIAHDEYDEKYQEAVELVRQTGQASISMLQRRLRVGYNRAARMIEIMEREGLVGPSDGIKPRQVLIHRT
jgi:S-DNA-T family DNA segregation ATPase FtsK/SpoIIIE